MLNLLWALAATFVVMWVAGVVVRLTLGGFLHVLLVMAIVSVLVRIILGRRIA